MFLGTWERSALAGVVDSMKTPAPSSEPVGTLAYVAKGK